MHHLTKRPALILSTLSILGLSLLLVVGTLAAQTADEPLEPLVVGGDPTGNTADSGEAKAGMVGGMEVHSLPPGKSLVLRFDNMDDLSGFQTLFFKMDGEEYRRVPEEVVRLRSDGIYRFSYYGVDKAGNKNTPRTRQLMIDSTAPTVRSTVVNSKVTRSGAVGKDAKLSLSAKDSGTGVKSIMWRPGRDGEWQQYTAPIALAKLSGDGQRLIEYKATDRIENETISSIFSYTIDTTAPSIPVILPEQAEDAEPILVRRDSLEVPPLEEGSTLEYKLDDGSYAPLKPGQKIPLPESGEHTLTLRTTDELGNVRETTYRIKVDVTPPVTTIRAEE
ncbi:MAG: hypothetical protein NXI24_07425 [bacterium]|nr:hypothetical protein [bacterium]